jgi:membrane-associated phospholipid phosphatase
MSSLAALSGVLLLGVCNSLSGQTAGGPAAQSGFESGDAVLPDAPQPQAADPVQAPNRNETTLRNIPSHVLKDQAAIWTSPLRIQARDLEWLAPLAAATGAAIATDHRALASYVSHDATFNHENVDASNVLTAGLIVAPVALYGAGRLHADAHAQEAGILGSEALLDGLVVEQGMKLVFWRERPGVNHARGHFFQTAVGVDSSFPSSHSMLAWSSAAVIAGEYPSRWVQAGAYSAAAGVGISRILGQEHFPSDVLVGSAVGWLVGHYVYRKHHSHWLKAR